MGTESGDGLADKPPHEIARALSKVLWSKVGIEADVRAAEPDVHAMFTAGEAAVLTEYLRDSERRPF